MPGYPFTSKGGTPEHRIADALESIAANLYEVEQHLGRIASPTISHQIIQALQTIASRISGLR